MTNNAKPPILSVETNYACSPLSLKNNWETNIERGLCGRMGVGMGFKANKASSTCSIVRCVFWKYHWMEILFNVGKTVSRWTKALSRKDGVWQLHMIYLLFLRCWVLSTCSKERNFILFLFFIFYFFSKHMRREISCFGPELWLCGGLDATSKKGWMII